MNNEEYDQWEEKITRVARAITQDFPYCEQEDIVQTIWVGLLEAQQKGALTDINNKYTQSGLFFIGQKAAWNERRQHLTISVQYGYRTSDVRKLLETFFSADQAAEKIIPDGIISSDNWLKAQVPDDAASELGNIAVEMSADMSRAWERMPRHYQAIIYYKFACKESVDSKRLSRAISRLADLLNTYEPKSKRSSATGDRKVITNAHAQTSIARQYDGDDE